MANGLGFTSHAGPSAHEICYLLDSDDLSTQVGAARRLSFIYSPRSVECLQEAAMSSSSTVLVHRSASVAAIESLGKLLEISLRHDSSVGAREALSNVVYQSSSLYKVFIADQALRVNGHSKFELLFKYLDQPRFQKLAGIATGIQKLAKHDRKVLDNLFVQWILSAHELAEKTRTSRSARVRTSRILTNAIDIDVVFDIISAETGVGRKKKTAERKVAGRRR